jgi:hypothetical protein
LASTKPIPDISDNPIGVPENLGAGISKNSESHSGQFGVSCRISLQDLGLQVLASVDFYDHHFRRTAKVNDVVADGLLSVELHTSQLFASDPGP